MTKGELAVMQLGGSADSKDDSWSKRHAEAGGSRGVAAGRDWMRYIVQIAG